MAKVLCIASSRSAMKRIFIYLFLLSTFVATLRADMRTFTDQFGRTIVAELLGVENDQIRIRREDGMIFMLPISKLTKADQKYVRTWEAAQPASTPEPEAKATIDPSKLVVNLSRVKTATRTLAKWDGYTHKHEDWAYTIELLNQHIRAVDNVRIEYNLFARMFPDSSPSTGQRITGAKRFDVIASRDKGTLRTGTAEVCRRRGIYFGSGSGEMRGIWYRVYVDDTLVIESSSPETLMANEKWIGVGKAD